MQARPALVYELLHPIPWTNDHAGRAHGERRAIRAPSDEAPERTPRPGLTAMNGLDGVEIVERAAAGGHGLRREARRWSGRQRR